MTTPAAPLCRCGHTKIEHDAEGCCACDGFTPAPPSAGETREAEPPDEVYPVGPDLRKLGRILATGKPVDDPTEEAAEPAGGQEKRHPCHDPWCERRP